MTSVDLGLPPSLERPVRVRLARLEADGFAARLARQDPTLWGEDPHRREVAASRLGWLASPSWMRPQTAALRAFAAEVAGEGYERAILLGMGGSSLAPEVLRRSLGVASGFLDLEVLDNTSPAAVRAVLDGRDPRRTLFVVSSKSGTTIEVSSFERVALAWVQAELGNEAGRSFVAITDPDTPLERLARERGYRRVFRNPPDIGGRYSALSCFGMVPAALLGADLDALLGTALAEGLEPGAAGGSSPALQLGAALGELALAGRDKVTLLIGRPLDALGSWIEQLLAESTGKEGRGLVPVVDEPLASPEAYGEDRTFVSVTVGPPGADLERGLAALRQAGHPVLAWSRPDAASLGAEFLRWEIATAVAGAVLGIDPFDEPNVAEAKQATQAILKASSETTGARVEAPPALASARGLAVMAPGPVVERLRPIVAEPSDPRAWALAMTTLAQPGDYVALLAFFHATPARRERLQRLRDVLRLSTGRATTLGFGPRFLHSTGQLHKGGPDRGVFLQMVATEGDLAIPGESYGFRTLQAAQALGDYQVLERHGRRVLRLDLGGDVERGLEVLTEAFSAASQA